jgi:ABC-type transporter Mla MlaB component
MPHIFCTVVASEGLRQLEVSVERSLTVLTAAPLCRVVRDHLGAGIEALRINLEQVKATDPVGLAALLQSARRAERAGVRLSVTAGAAAYRALLLAKLVAELPLTPSDDPAPLLLPNFPVNDAPAGHRFFMATTRRLGLRLPAWEDLRCFEQWAREPLLDQMVGSELLYLCRHLGAFHPDFIPYVLNDPTALTLLVHPIEGPWSPVGYVRLFNVNLVEQFAFLEVAIADVRSLRHGWGIEAARLLLAYAQDALELRRVEAKVYAYNVLSVNSLKRNGFRQEGVLRQARTYEGQRWDILLFAILHEQMEEQRRREGFPYMGFWGAASGDAP